MPQKILVTYYSQSGQLKEIMQNVSKVFADADEYEVTYYEIKLKEDFAFPWTAEVFYNTFPESYLQVPKEIIPPSDEILNKKYDLILFGYQVWFLTPSIPVVSFLKSTYAEKLLADTPLVTISGTRNMWMLSQDKLKIHLERLKAKLVGNIALVDRHDNYTSVLTILNWLQTGNKAKTKYLPEAGVAQKEIDEAGKFGKILKKYADQKNYEGMQKELVQNGAVEVRPFLLKVETVGNKLFTVFSGIIKKNPAKRKFWVGLYKFYLYVAIWVVSPIVLFFWTLMTPFFQGKRKKQIIKYQGL